MMALQALLAGFFAPGPIAIPPTVLELGCGHSTQAAFRAGALHVVSLTDDREEMSEARRIVGAPPAGAKWDLAPYAVFMGDVMFPAWLTQRQFSIALVGPEHIEAASKLADHTDAVVFLEFMGERAGLHHKGFSFCQLVGSPYVGAVRRRERHPTPSKPAPRL